MNDMQELRADLWESIACCGVAGINEQTYHLLTHTHYYAQDIALGCENGEADILIEPLEVGAALIAKYASPESLH